MARTFHDLIAENRRNSFLLVVAFVVLISATVYAIGVFLADGDPRSGIAPAGVALVAAGGLSLGALYGGSNAILGMSRARRIAKEDDPQLYNVVEEISIAAGIPMPALYLIDDTALNAFATGRDPKHAAVAITKGLRDRLTRDELQGVLAHEIAHVRNYDIRFSMLLAVLVGFLVLVCDVFRRYLWWGGGSRRRRSSSSDRGGGGGAGAILVVLAIVLSIIAPLLARMIQLAASRQREYLADASAVELTRYPQGLAGALEKLGNDREILEVANRATQHLYIVNPIKSFEKRAKGLFSTHPPLQERIDRLRALGRE
ncbi:MAG: M48 family metalloprotease [Candidatus Eisenbacteria bacterium]|nr:M48 family metalloprotease [Candidatus Latescibacterota bacterium]MBD3302324.1 M48 family metalloprotease [Candidatus Eisenbacteria bacterium]